MRITLEHTDTLFGEDSRKATVEIGRDDLSITEMWEDIIKPALLAMTFPESTVDGWVRDYNPDDQGAVELAFIGGMLARDEPEPPALVDLEMKWQTRDGREVTGLHDTHSGHRWTLQGYVSGQRISWTEEGKWSVLGDSHRLDLVPAKEGEV